MSHNFDKIIKISEIQFIQVDNLCTVLSHSVMSDSLLPHGLQPARLLCSWGFSRQDYCSGCHALLQGIFPIQGSNPETKKKKINFLGKTTQVLRDLRKYVCQNNTGVVNNDIPLTFVTQFLKNPNPQGRSEKTTTTTTTACNIDILKIIFMVGWQWFICFACQCSPAFFLTTMELFYFWLVRLFFRLFMYYAAAKSLPSCLILCDPIDGSPPGSPVPGILQARTLEWVAISFSNA